MTTLTAVFLAIDIRKKTWSSSDDNWRFIVNADGVDVVRQLFRPVAHFGEVWVTFASDFPAEGHAVVYAYGDMGIRGDLVPTEISIDGSALNPSSLRIETLGADLLRTESIIAWGWDAAKAVVPLAANLSPPNISTDPDEGFTSIPLGLAESGGDATTFTEVLVYIERTLDRNAGTEAPVSLRFVRADGTLVDSAGLDGFDKLASDHERSADIWRLSGLAPLSRSDAAGPIVPTLRIDGPDNAQIARAVVFGLASGGMRPTMVPLVDFTAGDDGLSGWLGPNNGGDRDLRLPLCAAAMR